MNFVDIQIQVLLNPTLGRIHAVAPLFSEGEVSLTQSLRKI